MTRAPHVHLLPGKEHRTPDTFHLDDISQHVALGTTPGNPISIAKKRDDNEDAAAWVTFDHMGNLATLADAHFGAESAFIALDYMHTHFSQSVPYLLRQMFRLHLEIDNEIRSLHKQHGRFRMTSATTFISCYILDDTAYYCSTGDSRILRLRRGQLEDLTPAKPIFLGDPEPLWRQISILIENYLPEIQKAYLDNPYHTLFQLTSQLRGIRLRSKKFSPKHLKNLDPKLEYNLKALVSQFMPYFDTFGIDPGDIIILASDGITPEASALEDTDIEALLRPVPPTAVQTAEALLKATIGDDNLTLVVYHAPYPSEAS